MDEAESGKGQIHDLGLVLARGQTLRHAFSLENKGSRPLAILGVEAMTPCCSAVEAVPPSVAPGERVEVPAIFKVGRRSGHKRLVFLARTDEPGRGVRPYTLLAEVLAEFEVRTLDGEEAALPLGEPGRRRFAVICRRRGEEGLDAPSSVESSASLSAAFAGPPERRDLGGGVVEATRTVEVALPPMDREGRHSGAFTLHWPGGESRPYSVTWDVVPRIRANPSALVLTGEAESNARSVLLHSSDVPFKVLGVSGAALASPVDLPDGSAMAHRLRLDLSAGSEGSMASDIQVRTDHPAQPIVVVSVVVVPKPPESSR